MEVLIALLGGFMVGACAHAQYVRDREKAIAEYASTIAIGGKTFVDEDLIQDA